MVKNWKAAKTGPLVGSAALGEHAATRRLKTSLKLAWPITESLRNFVDFLKML